MKLLFHTTNNKEEILRDKIIRGNPYVSLSESVLPQFGDYVFGIPFDFIEFELVKEGIDKDFIKYEDEWRYKGNLDLNKISFVHFKIKYSPYSARG